MTRVKKARRHWKGYYVLSRQSHAVSEYADRFFKSFSCVIMCCLLVMEEPKALLAGFSIKCSGSR